MAVAIRRVMDCDPTVFRRDLNVLPYEIGHTLAGHPLFQLPALVRLAQQVAARRNPHMSGGDAYFNEGAVEAETRPVYEDTCEGRTDDELVDQMKSLVFTAAQGVKRKLKKGDGVLPQEAKAQKQRIAAMVAARALGA